MFNVGDKITYGPKAHKGRIIAISPTHDQCTVEFDDRDLIPPQMDVPVEHLSHDYSYSHYYGYGNNTDKTTNCPRCGDKWKETWIGYEPFYDCLKCNLKREDA